MKGLILFYFVLLIFSTVTSQVEMEKWRMHVSPNVAEDVVYADGSVFAILGNALLEYDIEKEEQSLWAYTNFLSDVSPSSIAYDKKTKTVIIGYENGNLDLLKSNRIYNIPAIKLANTNGVKRINKITTRNGLAYLSTGVGIVVIDLQKKEVKDTYHPSNENLDFLDIAFYNDSIYAIDKNGVYVGKISSPFLMDPSQWKKKNTIPSYAPKGKYTNIEAFGDDLFLLFYSDSVYFGDTLYKINSGNLEIFETNELIRNIQSDDGFFLVSHYDNLKIYDGDYNQVEKIFQSKEGNHVYPNGACSSNNGFYIADSDEGLFWVKDNYNNKYINFQGPRHNSVYRVKWTKDKLSIACGGIGGSGPLFSKDGGSVMENEQWISTEVFKQPMLNNTHTWDFISTAINPTNKDIVAYGTNSGVPLIITDKGKVVDTFGFYNSLIEETGNIGWGNIADMSYDDNGNLWVLNGYSIKPIKVMTSNGTWYDYNIGSNVNNRVALRFLIDRNGIKWASFKELGLVAFDDNGTLSNSGDDHYRLFTTGVNDGALPSFNVYAIASDFDNNIWIGTEEGMRVLYNTENIFTASPGQYNFQKLLIEYGENVEIVLGTTHITAIAIDGANRKWIGTATSGVFLLSPDGLSIERKFTTENSPLLSNSIMDITINQTTGEVFFVTEKGLVSYRSDASQGDDEFSNVKIFPNPVYPNFDGVITIQGVAYNSDVKITDASGKLVYQTHSNGGTATWNGKTMDGKPVSTGVYLIWSSIDSDEYKGRHVGKILIIN
ncbi:MAG: T9SS type A sorting domain-containing protein [Brumimicrobium sp.]|nr:T9SS type A sorting domain-containing protein [Brumimicrobium sp.]